MTDIINRLSNLAAYDTWLVGIPPADLKRAASEIERLRAELVEAQKQAAAYRFIRAGNILVQPEAGGRLYVSVQPMKILRGGYCHSPEEFDAVIFAAMENDNG